jgi:pimeloyl-ACP methyl ester carboxylesterase
MNVYLRASTLALAICGWATSAIAGGVSTAVIDDPIYARPQRLVEIEPNRRLNVHCTGIGSPTVVFDSSQTAETSEWGLVQPTIAKRTRACSYDRAGVGFSDPAKRPSSSANIVDDLHRLLVAASIDPPYVLVGHSYGGMNIKLYAYQYPSEVVGMVFVDPSHEDQRTRYRRLNPRQPTELEYDRLRLEPVLAMRRECIATAPVSFTPGTELYGKCVGERDPRFSEEINAAHMKSYATAGFQEANMSEEEATFHASAQQLRDARRSLGDIPIIVLTSDTRGPGSKETEPPNDPQFRLWFVLHDDIAALSSRGSNRLVRQSGHLVHTDQPKAVSDAILEVLGAAR